MSSYEFTAEDADVVLYASRCDVPREFRVHRTLLSIASPVFKAMFSLPQPTSSATPTEAPIPVIDVDDTPEDLEVFLRIIYPFGLPPLSTLDAVSRALDILDKYQVQDGTLRPIRSLLVSPEFLKSDPVQVYSLACGWKFKKEANIAAPYTSCLDVVSHIREEDVPRMTSVEYHRILILGKERREKGTKSILTLPAPCADFQCWGNRKFYTAFRKSLAAEFDAGCSSFYDYGECISRCYQIASETEKSEVALGCGMGRGSHLGTFIRNLATELSNNP